VANGDRAERLRPSAKERAPLTKDNRKERRILEENRVHIEVPSAGPHSEPQIINALTHDISLGGARIVTDVFFEQGSSLKITLYLSKSKQVAKVRAEVRWIRAIASGLYEMGVEFQHGIPSGIMVLITHLYGKGQTVPSSVQS
jgi:hypothetical protein